VGPLLSLLNDGAAGIYELWIELVPGRTFLDPSLVHAVLGLILVPKCNENSV
jgi:hypothetical protein